MDVPTIIQFVLGVATLVSSLLTAVLSAMHHMKFRSECFGKGCLKVWPAGNGHRRVSQRPLRGGEDKGVSEDSSSELEPGSDDEGPEGSKEEGSAAVGE